MEARRRRVVGVFLQPLRQLLIRRAVGGRGQIALRQDMPHQPGVAELADQPVGGGPVALFLQREDLHVAVGVDVLERLRQIGGRAVGTGGGRQRGDDRRRELIGPRHTYRGRQRQGQRQQGGAERRARSE